MSFLLPLKCTKSNLDADNSFTKNHVYKLTHGSCRSDTYSESMGLSIISM